jgi:hypothetical protein
MKYKLLDINRYDPTFIVFSFEGNIRVDEDLLANTTTLYIDELYSDRPFRCSYDNDGVIIDIELKSKKTKGGTNHEK